MKLLIAFIQKEDAGKLLRRFRDENIAVTSMESEGGFLRRRNVTIFMALPDNEVEKSIAMIRDLCRGRREQVDTTFGMGTIEGVGLPTTTEIPVGGATVLLLPIAEIIKIDEGGTASPRTP